MSLSRSRLAVLSAIFAFATVICVAAQDQPPPKEPAPQPPNTSHLTIEVTGGEKDSPVENASVYLTYVEEHAIKKNKKTELNVKTNHDGLAHIPEAPFGRARVQIVADGWKPFGRWYDITDPSQTIKVSLEKPPKWY
jgi:hypothetical protein